MKSKKLGNTVVLLGLVSLLNDLSSEMIMPILPLFIVSLGGGAIAIGVIGGVADSLSSLLKVFSGYWADKIGRRKPYVFMGYMLSSAAKLLYSIATTWPLVLTFRMLDRIGKGLRTAPRDALIADATRKQRRGTAFGLHRAMDSFGAVLGTMTVLMLFWFFSFNFQTIFLVAGIIGFAALIPLFLVKEKKAKRQQFTFKASLKGLSKEFKKFLLIASIFYIGNFSYMFFILRARESIGGNFFEATVNVLLLYALYNIIYTLFSYPAGKLSDKIGRKKTLSIAYLLFALTCLGFAFFNSFYVFIALFCLYGLFFAFAEGNEKAFASDLSQKKHKATTLGVLHTITGLTMLPASLIAGSLWTMFAPEVTFLFSFITSVIAAVGILTVVK